MKKTVIIILISGLVLIAVLWGASQHLGWFDKNEPVNKSIINDYSDTTYKNNQWYVYNNPVNGFDISILARFNYCDYGCMITVYLEKGVNKYAVDLNAAYDSFYPYGLEKDTIYIDNPTHPDSTWFFDHRTVVTFADVNFDGEDELILCGFPRPNLDFETNFLDCEDYTVYKVTNDSIEQIRNVLFDELSKGVCRTDYIIDTVNESITLIGYSWAYGEDKYIYSFRNGEPYKLDYIKIDYDYDDSLYENPRSKSFHFNLPADTAKFEYLIDSIYGFTGTYFPPYSITSFKYGGSLANCHYYTLECKDMPTALFYHSLEKKAEECDVDNGGKMYFSMDYSYPCFFSYLGTQGLIKHGIVTLEIEKDNPVFEIQLIEFPK